MRQIVRFVIAAVIALAAPSVYAQGLGWDYQEQARSHVTDVQHIEMHIAFDPAAKKVMGTVYHTMAVLPEREPVKTFPFDAVNMTIEKVWLQEGKKQVPLEFDTEEAGKLNITLDKLHPANVPFTIGIQYWAIPKKGMYFIAADTFYSRRTPEIWTQGEGEDNRNWLPTYDYPNDKTTTEMFVTVQGNQKALSNGHLIGKEKNKDGTVTWHWKEEHPYSTYLIMLGIGDYDVVTEKWRGKDVDYWVYPGWGPEAHRIFGLTPKMMEFYSNKTGYPYAWEKYDQIAIEDFMYGGMENVSATTLNDYVLFDKRSGIDFSSEGLIAHELAHQWFGDLVTCRSWLHTWLNESFATYFEGMFRQYQDGQDEFDEEMYGAQNAGMDAERNLGKKPVVATNNYTANLYPRGAATLNMVRHILGDSAWWASIHHYLDVHQFQPVVTEDFKMAIEEASGQNLQWFFDEWVYKSGHPVFDVTEEYDDAAKVVRLGVTQTQQRDSLTGTFKMPVDVELTMPDGTTRMETLHISDSSQHFTMVSPQKPVMVIFDKGHTIIKELHIHKSTEEWRYQLANAPLAIERSEAALNLIPKPLRTMEMAEDSLDNNISMGALKQAAVHDPFWAVQLHALNTLYLYSDDHHDISDILIQLAEHDPRPDVRAQAVEFMRHISGEKAVPVLTRIINTDSSYNVVGKALASLQRFDSAGAYRQAMNYLSTSSPRDRMRQSAINIIEGQNNHQALDELLRLINQHDIPKWTRWSIIGSIGNMVSVDSPLVVKTLWNLSNNGDYAIRGTALNKLADIGDVNMLHEIEAQAATRPDMKVTYDSLLARMRKRLGVPEPPKEEPSKEDEK